LIGKLKTTSKRNEGSRLISGGWNRLSRAVFWIAMSEVTRIGD
jgi:hypothetical protein